MSRYDPTDFEWRVIKSLLSNKPQGSPRVDDRRVLNGAFWMLRSGARWCDPPERYGSRSCFSKRLYSERNLIERFFSKLKYFRRVAARYDKLAANFLAMVQLASMRLWLRAYEFKG